MGASSKQLSVLREVSDVARGVVLGSLVIAGVLGLAWDVFAIIALNTMKSADGLGGELPFFGIVLFLPLQLAAALVVRGWWQRHKLEKRRPSAVSRVQLPADSLPFTTVSAPVLEGVDDDVFEKERARRVVRWAQWLLGVPAAAMVLAALMHFLGLRELYDTLREPMSVFFWFPSWCAGLVTAVVALSRYGRWLPLALATLYPLFLREF